MEADDPVTSWTPHEKLENAHIAVRCAWLMPDDDELVECAIEACAVVGVRYAASIEGLMAHTGATERVARYELAESLRRAADKVAIEYASVTDTFTTWLDDVNPSDFAA